MSAHVRCPKCGSRSDQGGGFDVLVPYRAVGVMDLVGVQDDGTMIVRGVDGGQPDRFARPEVYCGDCGHQWTTTREWVQ